MALHGLAVQANNSRSLPCRNHLPEAKRELPQNRAREPAATVAGSIAAPASSAFQAPVTQLVGGAGMTDWTASFSRLHPATSDLDVIFRSVLLVQPAK
jgi:hypothetical protein